jgi:hypothetical protein
MGSTWNIFTWYCMSRWRLTKGVESLPSRNRSTRDAENCEFSNHEIEKITSKDSENWCRTLYRQHKMHTFLTSRLCVCLVFKNLTNIKKTFPHLKPALQFKCKKSLRKFHSKLLMFPFSAFSYVT